MNVDVDVDNVFKSLGIWGRWQILQITLVQLQYLAASFQLLAIVFLGYEPPFSCLDEEFIPAQDSTVNGTNSSDVYVQDGDCKLRNIETNKTSSCSHGYFYDAPMKESTIVTEWDLVCDKEYQMQLTQTIFIAGQAVGATVTTIIADRYGRKWVSILSQLAVFALAVGTAYSPNILVFSILRFPMGAFQQGIVMSGSVLPLELIPVENRALTHLIGSVTWTSCLTLISGFGYAFRNYSWRKLQLGYCSVSLFVTLHILFLDESLRWLYANGKTKEAAKLVKKIIRRNGAKIDKVLQQCLDLGKGEQPKRTGNEEFDNHDINKSPFDTWSADSEKSVSIYDNEPIRPLETDRVDSIERSSQSSLNTKDENSKTDVSSMIKQDFDPRVDSGEGIPTTVEKSEANPDRAEFQTLFNEPPKEVTTSKYTILDIIKNRTLLFTALVTCCGWIVNSLVYFGLTLASSKLAGNRFVNFALLSVVELPAGIISFVTMQKLGRKLTVFIFDCLAGIVLIVAVALKTVYGNNLTITALSIAGKFGASAAFGTLFTYTPELYPTNLRSLGLGISSAAARIGGMIAPFSVLLIKYVPWAPGTIFGTLCLIVSVVFLLLPETRDKELPQTIEEIEQWSKRRKKKIFS